jgi:hypothetical protein
VIFDNGHAQIEYTKTCRDFDYTGVRCCDICHEEDLAQYELAVVTIDNEPALLCCQMKSFFYPDDPQRGLSPEEKLLRAIFGEGDVHVAAKEPD